MTDNRRELNKRVLERIANDPAFRQEILDDPKGAMERAGFVWEQAGEDDVSGYGLWPTTALTCTPGEGKSGGIAGSGGTGGAPTTALTCTEPGPPTDPAQWPANTEPTPTWKVIRPGRPPSAEG